MTFDDIHLAAGTFALDALDAAEHDRFEAHLHSCDLCAGDTLGFAETATLLATAVATVPPPELRTRVLAEVARTRQLSPIDGATAADTAELPAGFTPPAKPAVAGSTRGRRSSGRLLAAAAAVLVSIGLGVAVAGLLGDDDRMSPTEAVLAAADAEVVDLNGGNGSATLRVVYSAERDEVAVIGSELDGAGDGMTYQLWSLADETGSAGVFLSAPDGEVNAVLSTDSIPDPAPGARWGVTIEPDGGSPQPTTEIIYVGDVA